ncbi:P2Y purinoceptor 13-like [Lepisosteus oculatus]|uniref:P2Y purinoceptor 13-like n=1 Tax=Lepisosteus oculatus TaxID=7918 RepID=UPI00073FD479|nr:PREDICTED: P2Y purinoceptor 13-like [Lepisosteus oculatus]XP_015216406.1 PREDICTED: P2Y purinoceptor 13-like [Lepisosteus oculatus]
MNSSQPESTCYETFLEVIPVLYGLLFIPALVLNCLAGWVSFQIRTESTFILYLKNLIVVDFIMTLTILTKAISKSKFGQTHLVVFACRFSDILFYFSMYISIIFLGVISLDRYFKIVRPFGKLLGQNLTYGKFLTAFIWISFFCTTALPNMILTNKKWNGTANCISLKDRPGIIWHEVVIYICQTVFAVVCVLIVFTYVFISRKVYESYKRSQSCNERYKRQTKARVFIVIVVFFICFVPYHLVRVPFTKIQVDKNTTCIDYAWSFSKELSLWLSATNTCLDPLIYILLCKSFRNRVCEIFRRKTFNISNDNDDSTQ